MVTWPLMIPLICLRETPANSANSVAVTPCGARYNSRSIFPGAVGRRLLLQIVVMALSSCGGLGDALLANSVVVLEVHVEDVAFVAALELERYAHIAADLHGVVLLAL